jgi:hypothetical protein
MTPTRIFLSISALSLSLDLDRAGHTAGGKPSQASKSHRYKVLAKCVSIPSG